MVNPREDNQSGGAIIHAFFGALISVVAAKLLEPFFSELWIFSFVILTLALAFLLLNLGFAPIRLANMRIEFKDAIEETAYTIHVPLVPAIVGLVLVSVLIPRLFSIGNDLITDESQKVGLHERYIFAILYAVYILSLVIYNRVMRALRIR